MTDLIERLREVGAWAYNQPDDYITEGDLMNKAADTIERQAAEMELLRAKVAYLEGQHSSIVGFPWDSPFMDGVEAGKSEYRATIERQAALLKQCKVAFAEIAWSNDSEWQQQRAQGVVVVIEEYERALP
jgi:hypothetical protein